MKTGIDSYCYHRFFGEVYPGQKQPDREMTMDDFLERAKSLRVDGVSLESCFFLNFDKAFFADLKQKLDDYKFDRVYAWGHPNGLERGKNQAAYDDMVNQIPNARLIGADIMRVVGGSNMFRHEPRGPQVEALGKLFKEAMKIADDYEVKLAIENHIDYTGDEIMQILELVDNENFGVNFDTGNFLRLLDDPIAAMEKLAPYVFSTHIKDLMPNPCASPADWFFFSGVPVGRGLIDNRKLAELLHKANYNGFLAVEIDNPHPLWAGCEDEAVGISIKALKDIFESIESYNQGG